MSYIVIIITRLLKFNWEHAQNNGQKITAIGPTDTFVHWTHSKHSKTTLWFNQDKSKILSLYRSNLSFVLYKLSNLWTTICFQVVQKLYTVLGVVVGGRERIVFGHYVFSKVKCEGQYILVFRPYIWIYLQDKSHILVYLIYSIGSLFMDKMAEKVKK